MPGSLRCQVRYFAIVRERLARDQDLLDLPAGARIDDLLAALVSRHPALAPLVPHLRVAVNRDFAPLERVLADGDEVALIPPVAGGASMSSPGTGPAARWAVVDRPISLDEVLAAVEGEAYGGVVTFTGRVRRHSAGRIVERIEYEAYREMAEAKLGEIVAEVEQRCDGARCAIVHRVGTLVVGEVAVVIAVAAPHRAPAFEGCRLAIERLKEAVPIWKKEYDREGGCWVGMGP